MLAIHTATSILCVVLLCDSNRIYCLYSQDAHLAGCVPSHPCSAAPGPAQDFEPVGAEQLAGRDAAPSEPQAPAVKRAPTTTSTAAAPAGADTDELRARAQDAKESIKARLQVRLCSL